MAKNTLITYDNLSAYTENIKNSYAPKTHSHSYLNLTGGTLSGCLTVESVNWNNQLKLVRKNNGANWGPSISFYSNDNNVLKGMGNISMQDNKLYIEDVGGTTSSRKEVAVVGHTHGNISSAGTIAGAASRVVVTDSSGKITSSSTVTTGELDTLNVISGNSTLNSFSTNRSAAATLDYSFAEGRLTVASGTASHAEGRVTIASNTSSHAEGEATQAIGFASHAEGDSTQAIGEPSHAEGRETIAEGIASHAEGEGTHAEGDYSHAEGYETLASGEDSHAEGYLTEAIGGDSHAEGYNTRAYSYASHAEGEETYANGDNSHAEGHSSGTEGIASHAEGYGTLAGGDYSHAEGYFTVAEGIASHAEGIGTLANYDYLHACGKYNKYGVNDALFVVGNGEDENNRNNAFMIDSLGNGYFAGNVLINAEFDEEGIATNGVWVSDLGGGGSGDYAPKVHTATTTTYGAATTSAYGHVKISNGDVATVASANGLAAGMDHSHSNYAPKVHTATTTTYGVGTTSAYGHVKLATGDCSSTYSNGIAASSKHDHQISVNATPLLKNISSYEIELGKVYYFYDFQDGLIDGEAITIFMTPPASYSNSKVLITKIYIERYLNEYLDIALEVRDMMADTHISHDDYEKLLYGAYDNRYVEITITSIPMTNEILTFDNLWTENVNSKPFVNYIKVNLGERLVY